MTSHKQSPIQNAKMFLGTLVNDHLRLATATAIWITVLEFPLLLTSLRGGYTLGDKLQQNVVATDHPCAQVMRLLTCSKMLGQHVAVTNRLMCTREFLWKSVSTTEFCHCIKSQKIKSDWICVTCCRDKDFQKFSNTHEFMFLKLVPLSAPTFRNLFPKGGHVLNSSWKRATVVLFSQSTTSCKWPLTL